jgi:hypothetical protein
MATLQMDYVTDSKHILTAKQTESEEYPQELKPT